MAVNLNQVVRRMNLRNLTPEMSLAHKEVSQPDINRPALQLAGYFEHFADGRLQIIGMVEWSYMQQMTQERRHEIYAELLAHQMPCVVICRSLEPDELFLEYARKNGVPVLQTPKATSAFEAELIRWLSRELAPMISMHGVLVDVYGVGVLLKGESGIGKSEAALELIKRGHRLVADDCVEVRRVSADTLLGTAPAITKHLIELRGIGIVDVKTLFGVSSVRESQTIDLIIHLEEWSKDSTYDRLGLQEEYEEILGNQVTCHRIPIRPGRNIAVICETAAANHRQKMMGYNAAQVLYDRVQKNMMRKNETKGNGSAQSGAELPRTEEKS